MNPIKKSHFAILFTYTVFVCFISYANDLSNKQNSKKYYTARGEIEYKHGSDRGLRTLNFFQPIFSNKNNLVFLDARYWIDNQKTNEFNLGLGHRNIVADKFIFGKYAFFDKRRTASNKEFHQATIGGEILTRDYDFRVNFYLPTDDVKTVSSTSSFDSVSSSTNQYLLKQNSVYNSSSTSSYVKSSSDTSLDASMKGYDIEFGKKFLHNQAGIFLAYYHFFNNKISEKIDGYRVREEFRIFNHKNHSFYTDAEYSYDDLRSENTFFGFRYRYQIGSNIISTNKSTNFEALQARMTDRIVRDVDIVTKKKEIVTSSSSAPQTSATETAIANQRIFYVDNSSTNDDGSCTKEKPCTTISGAISKATNPNDIVFIYKGNGAQYQLNSQITLDNNKKLISKVLNLNDLNGQIINQNLISDDYANVNLAINGLANSSSFLMGGQSTIRGINFQTTGVTPSNYAIIKNNTNATEINIVDNKFFGATTNHNVITIDTNQNTAVNITSNHISGFGTSGSFSGVVEINANSNSSTFNISNNKILSSKEHAISLVSITPSENTININNNELNSAIDNVYIDNGGGGKIVLDINNNIMQTQQIGVDPDSNHINLFTSDTYAGKFSGTIRSNIPLNSNGNSVDNLLVKGSSLNLTLNPKNDLGLSGDNL